MQRTSYTIACLIFLLLLSNGWWWSRSNHQLAAQKETQYVTDSIAQSLFKVQADNRQLENNIRYFWQLLTQDSSAMIMSATHTAVSPQSVAHKIIHDKKLRQQLWEQLLRVSQEHGQLRQRKDITEQELYEMQRFLQRAEQEINLFSDSVSLLASALDSTVKENMRLKTTDIAPPAPLEFVSSKGRTVFYYGQSINDYANGKGVGLFWESGSLYKGDWKDNMRHGRGIFQWKDGERYEGEYRNDRREGYGVYHWKNGERYEGQWLNDMRHGNGTLYDKNNKVKISGLWDKDKPINRITTAN